MNGSVYMCESEQKIFVSEKFVKPLNQLIQIFYWKSDENGIGFNTDKYSLKFVKKMLDNKLSILFPSLKLIESNEDIEKNIHGLQGITFLNNLDKIKSEYDTYLVYEEQKKRNALLERYGKEIKELQSPALLGWYNQDRVYTELFSAYCIENQIKFIVWSYSESGIFFFNFSNVVRFDQEIEVLSRQLYVTFNKVDEMSKMPYH